MTINELLKLIPEEYRDKSIILIYIPYCRDGDMGNYPLIEVDIENNQIILTPDF
jgi:hypothetical protein